MAKKSTAKVTRIEVADELVTGLADGPVRVRSIPLNTLEGVRRQMARLFREAESGRRRTEDASRLSYMLSQIKIVIEAINDTEYAERLLEIETRLNLVKSLGSSNVRQLTAVPAAVANGDETTP